jgi:pyrroloquinoline-quinone synthase
MNQKPRPRKTFLASLRKIGAMSYHHQHPFHLLMNSGQLGRREIQIWAANRFYYQTNIPIKDAAIMANCPLREVRRLWLHRIIDHDGAREDEGGIGAWLRLGEACGLSRGELLDHRHVIPGVRFAVDAYVNFARTRPWPEAVASSLTELFAPDLMAKRLEAFKRFYRWVDASGLDYFASRLVQAPRDSGEALKLTLDHCDTREKQLAAQRALQFKCDLLWAMLDAIHGRCLALPNPRRRGQSAGHTVKNINSNPVPALKGDSQT